MPKRKYSIGQILMKSLTSEQIAGLLTVVSTSTDLNIYMEKFEKIDQGYAKALLFSDIFYKYCQATAGGGAQGNISPVEILNFAIPSHPWKFRRRL